MYFVSFCGSLYPFIKLVKIVLTLLKIAVPIALILFGGIDFGKAVIASKEDEMKKAQSIFVKRVIYGVAIFLTFTLVTFVMNFVADSVDKDYAGNPLNTSSWRVCWSCESKAECEAIAGGCFWDPENDKTVWEDFEKGLDKGYLHLEDYTTPGECEKGEKSACYLDVATDQFLWGPYSSFEGKGYSFVPSLTTKDQCLEKNFNCYLEEITGKYIWGSPEEYQGRSGFVLQRGLKEKEQCLNHN